MNAQTMMHQQRINQLEQEKSSANKSACVIAVAGFFIPAWPITLPICLIVAGTKKCKADTLQKQIDEERRMMTMSQMAGVQKQVTQTTFVQQQAPPPQVVVQQQAPPPQIVVQQQAPPPQVVVQQQAPQPQVVFTQY